MAKDNAVIKEMGRRIAELRTRLGITQEDLAEIAGISTQSVSNAERGIKALRPENLIKISTALCVSTDYLLTGNAFNDALIPREKLKDLTPAQLNKLNVLVGDFFALIEEMKNDED